MTEEKLYDVICIGAGPAGLSAGYVLSKDKKSILVLEASEKYVGGISRTEEYNGYLCDIGGHRFFSKSQEIEDIWQEILGEDFLQRPRKSRIYYNGKFFDYPLRAFDALKKLGPINSGLCVLSYFRSALLPVQNPKTFEDWVSNKFGKRLFNIFFKTYTEKVWGMKCSEISADWAAQRIKGFSLGSAIIAALGLSRKGKVKTLIDKFKYPRKGPGMMWDAAKEKIIRNGSNVLMGERVKSCKWDGAFWIVQTQNNIFKARNVISSMPLSELIRVIDPKPEQKVNDAAQQLKYRDFLVVGLVIKDRNMFDDNWIYIHEPSVKVGRIQNFKSWSPEMVPDQNNNCLGMEYFCFEGDGLWNMQDSDLVELAKKEVVKLNLVSEEDVLNGFVIRQPKAYPVYDDNYKAHLEVIKNGLSGYKNLYAVGRNGMHRYNNQDHSMMTAILAARNIIAGENVYDLWEVNEDAEYHEEVKDNQTVTERLVPKKVISS